jgi:hypothetical protein
MDPMMMMSLMQMAGNAGQGFGAALGTGGSSAWGNALGGSVLGGYLTGKGQKKAKKKAAKRFKRALNASESIRGKNFQQQDALSRQATSQRVGGFDKARGEAQRLGRSSKQDVSDRGARAGARASQNLQNRGLGSTTRGAAVQRGVAADTSRGIANVNQGLAGTYGNLAMGKGQAQAAGTQQLAGINNQRSAFQDQLQQMRQLGGATLGSLGSFDPGSWGQGYMPNTQSGMMEGMGSMMGSMGGGGGGMGGGGQGGMNPQMMQMIQQLFQGGGGGQ